MLVAMKRKLIRAWEKSNRHSLMFMQMSITSNNAKEFNATPLFPNLIMQKNL